MESINEQYYLNILKQNNIWYKLMGTRYSGNDKYHNWYIVGYTERDIFGELEFSKNPIWRLSWYYDGKIHHDSGRINTEFNLFIKKILKLSIPRY